MKRLLLASTALAAVLAASGASAQESTMMTPAGNTLSIGGYYEFGWASISDDFKGPDTGGDAFTYGDSELYIDFENTADNGLTYGVEIDLEIVDGSKHRGVDAGSTENTDEATIHVGGDFGTVYLGHDDNAYGRFQVWAPTHEGSTSQDDNVHVGGGRFTYEEGPGTEDDVHFAHAMAYSAAGMGSAYNDDAKVTYVSPSFSGFSFGASLEDKDNASDNPQAFGIGYTMDIGGGSISLMAGRYTNNADGDDKRTDGHYGISYTRGPLTFTAARYEGKGAWTVDLTDFPNSHVDLNSSTTEADDEVTIPDVDLKTTELGIGYKVSDAFSIGASWATAEAEKALENMGQGPDAHVGQEGDFKSVSGEYIVAPGLKTTLAVNLYDIENTLNYPLVDSTTGNPFPMDQWFRAGHKNDGTELVWQVEFSF